MTSRSPVRRPGFTRPQPQGFRRACLSGRQGFTLIELLLVIGIISVLMFITILAINPSRQLNSARDAQRRADINTIINGVYQYALDNNGIPTTITTTNTEICKTNYVPAAGQCINFRMLTGTYLVNIPFDPSRSTSTGTYYFVYKNSSNRVTITASGAQIQTNITVTR